MPLPNAELVHFSRMLKSNGDERLALEKGGHLPLSKVAFLWAWTPMDKARINYFHLNHKLKLLAMEDKTTQ